MPNLNKVMLMGNLTRDVELKTTTGNQNVASLSLAINRKFRTKEGEDREETTFVDCEAWGKTAEILAKYLSKGKPVYIEGRLKLDSWEDKDGQKRSKMRVVIEEFQFIDSRPGAGGGASGGGESSASRPPRSEGSYAPTRSSGSNGGQQQSDHRGISDEDIPF
ncbi:MAG: single-stranded DNA-binding protein [Phycisphaerales bacterium]|nr:single-stranded DNA-binding protein [Phycisphaerales bacterium]